MKKAIMTVGIMSVIAPTQNIVFADNGEIVRSISQTLNTTGTVVGIGNSVLNVRKGAGTNYSVVGTVKNGASLKITGKASNGWYKVSYNGKEGYVSNKYVSLNTSNSTGNKGKVNISNGNLNIRKSATTNSSIVGKIPAKSTVTILSTSTNGWYKVSYNGVEGYCSSKYITLTNTNSTTSSSTSGSNSNSSTTNKNIGKIATVKTNALNVRSGAGTSYSVINKVYSGNVVKIVGCNSNGWYNVELSSGAKGWCSAKYLGDFREGSLNQSSNSSSNTQSNSSNQTQSQKVQAVINLAKAQLGKPYVWGAEGPNSFDCSGLTQYVYKKAANVSLPRSSKSQGTVGTYVSKSNLQPGDLVFFDSDYGNTISHVGIYIGNNEMIHSPKPGDVVKVTKINSNHYTKAYITARRVL